MSHGFRSAWRLAATVATAAAVVGAASTARRILGQAGPDPPRHRAARSRIGRIPPVRIAAAHALAPPVVMSVDLVPAPAMPSFHPFGPEPCPVPSHGISTPSPTLTADVIELEASGELDGTPSPTERLLARRHAYG